MALRLDHYEKIISPTRAHEVNQLSYVVHAIFSRAIGVANRFTRAVASVHMAAKAWPSPKKIGAAYFFQVSE